MGVPVSTLNDPVMKETTASVSSHTIDHCRLQMKSQWSTAENVTVLGTNLTLVTVYGKLFLFSSCNTKGDYCDL